MGLLTRFDLDSDFTQFFLGLSIFVIILTILLTRVSAGRRRSKNRGVKYDDRRIERDRELID